MKLLVQTHGIVTVKPIDTPRQIMPTSTAVAKSLVPIFTFLLKGILDIDKEKIVTEYLQSKGWGVEGTSFTPNPSYQA